MADAEENGHSTIYGEIASIANRVDLSCWLDHFSILPGTS